MDIFFTVDDKFKNFFYTTLYTILSNAQSEDEFNFYVLDAGLSEETKKNVEKFKSLKNFTISYTPMTDEEFKDYPINPCLSSKVYYYRLKIPTMFPQVKRALFIDTDLFIMGSLAPLYNFNMNGHTIACVINANLEGELQNERLGLSSAHFYFNAGVLLIDCEKWRQDNILDKIKTIAKEKVDILKWADQDILNLVFENNYQILPPKFNFWPGLNMQGFTPNMEHYQKWFNHCPYTQQEILEALNHALIIHFAGGAKPNTPTGLDSIKKMYDKINDEIAQKKLVAGHKTMPKPQGWLARFFKK